MKGTKTKSQRFLMSSCNATSNIVHFGLKKNLTSNGCKPIRLLSKISVYQYMYTQDYNIVNFDKYQSNFLDPPPHHHHHDQYQKGRRSSSYVVLLITTTVGCFMVDDDDDEEKKIARIFLKIYYIVVRDIPHHILVHRNF